MPAYLTEINAAASIGTFIALIIAVTQIRSANKQTSMLRTIMNRIVEVLGEGNKQKVTLGEIISRIERVIDVADGHNTKLEKISQSVSTEYIGIFPSYISNIAELLNTTKTELLVLCTFPNHGVFSSLRDALNVRQTIERISLSPNGPKVRAIFGHIRSRRELLKFQFKSHFSNDLEFNNWKNSEEWKTRLHEFVTSYSHGTSLDSINMDEFYNIFDRTSETTIKNAFGAANVRIVNDRPSIYMWIVDRSSAIFVICSATPVFTAQGFKTNDEQLISALVSIFNEYETHAMSPDNVEE